MEELRLYYVRGVEKKDSPIWGGCHFAAWTHEECIEWVKQNFPDLIHVYETQFAFVDVIGQTVDMVINNTTPDFEDWQVAICFLK